MIYDINLLVKRKSKVTKSTILLITILSVLCVTVIAIYGVIYPLNKVSNLKAEIEDKKTELASYTYNEAIYYQVQQELEETRNTLSSLNNLKENEFKSIWLFETIEDIIPVDVKIYELNYGQGLLSMKGISPTYKNIAQFIVKASEVDGMSNVKTTQVMIDNNEDEVKYAFDLSVIINSPEELITSNSSEDMTGEEAAKSETN